MSSNLPQAQSVEEVFALFDRHGDVYYGEDINQNQHAVQCAELARREGASPEMIIATLLHDVPTEGMPTVSPTGYRTDLTPR